MTKEGKNKEEEMLPALENEDIRRLNTQKIVDAVDQVGGYMKEAKRNAKVTTYYIVGILIVFGFIIIAGFVMVAIKSGGVSEFFDNYFIVDNLDKRIICEKDGISFEYRTAQEAAYFIQAFDGGAQCHPIIKKGGTHEKTEHD